MPACATAQEAVGYSAHVSPAPFSLRKIAVPAFGPSFLFGLGEGAILPVVPLGVRDLGGSVSLAALIVTLIGVGSLASNLPASLITARYGERRAMVGAALWCALGMLLCIVARDIRLFAAGIFMVGMSGAVFNLARLTWLTEAVPHYFRARALSTLGGVMRMGLFVGPFAAAALMHFIGLAGAYWIGIAALLLAAGLALGVSDLPGESAPGSAASSGGRSGPTREAGAAGEAVPITLRAIALAHRKVYLTIGLGIVLISAVRASRQAIIPLWAEQIGLDAAATSLIYGLSNAIDMLVFYPAGKLMDARGRNWVAVPCMVIMGVALATMPFTHSAGTLLLASLLIGFGNGIGSGIVMTLGADQSPARGRTHFLGLWRLLSDLGGTSGPAMLSAVTAVATLAVGIGATSLLAFGGAAVLWYWIPRLRLQSVA
ncbi:MAG: MFS transporter [Burkholderiaceae bacterium]|nr:MFS transporter [Burkholderiaceae bacterium]